MAGVASLVAPAVQLRLSAGLDGRQQHLDPAGRRWKHGGLLGLQQWHGVMLRHRYGQGRRDERQALLAKHRRLQWVLHRLLPVSAPSVSRRLDASRERDTALFPK